MKVYGLGIIVEVGVPKLSQQSLKDESLNEEVCQFLRSLESVDDMKVLYADYRYNKGTEINDFNYNYANQVEKSQKYRVFRFFTNQLIVTSQDHPSFHQLHWFRYKDLLISISIGSIGTHEPSHKTEYVGKSQYNSGEIVEERVEQYSLFE